jgi:hypothetical protein
MKNWILIFGLLIPAFSQAQSYSIDWYKVAGGGGASSGTNGGSAYSLTGTIGQQDASAAMTGGAYSLTGGFWSLITQVRTPGTPSLTITHSAYSVIVSWPNTVSYTLQQNSDLAVSAAWTTSGYPVTTNSLAGTNSITITLPAGSLFFRLANTNE